MTTIIGIDPGSRITGYGLIQVQGNTYTHVASGCLRLVEYDTNKRLQQLFSGLQEVIRLYQPEEAAIEQIFMHANPNSALKLGQARGAAIVALGQSIFEYSARQVKQSVVGHGAAKKNQVQHMVQRLLNYANPLQADEADALAVALCHAHNRFSLHQLPLGSMRRKRRRSSSWRNVSIADK